MKALGKDIGTIHFVGIGGSGMSGIAEVLLNLGYNVSGSDLASNAASQRLTELGARVYTGHSAEHVIGANVVVTSTAGARWKRTANGTGSERRLRPSGMSLSSPASSRPSVLIVIRRWWRSPKRRR